MASKKKKKKNKSKKKTKIDPKNINPVDFETRFGTLAGWGPVHPSRVVDEEEVVAVYIKYDEQGVELGKSIQIRPKPGRDPKVIA